MLERDQDSEHGFSVRGEEEAVAWQMRHELRAIPTYAERQNHLIAVLLAFRGSKEDGDAFENSEDSEYSADDMAVNGLRDIVQKIFALRLPFLPDKGWLALQQSLFKNPNNPSLVYKLAKKLFDADMVGHVRELIFLKISDDPENQMVRWDENSNICSLGAFLLLRERKYKEVRALLAGKNGEARFPNDSLCARLLTRAHIELGNYEDAYSTIKTIDEDCLYEDPQLFSYFIQSLLKCNKREEITEIFSTSNEMLLTKIHNMDFLKPVFVFLHENREYALLYMVGDFFEKIIPEMCNQAEFVSFYSRACNALKKYEKSLQLLEKGNGIVTARFRHNVDCVKNLAYALRAMGHSKEARDVLIQGETDGLSKAELRHIDRGLRGRRSHDRT